MQACRGNRKDPRIQSCSEYPIFLQILVGDFVEGKSCTRTTNNVNHPFNAVSKGLHSKGAQIIFYFIVSAIRIRVDNIK